MEDLYVFDGGIQIESITYIFCSVRFNKDGKTYYYLTDNETLRIGDFVLVPVGNDEITTIAEIIAIDNFYKYEVPFPIHRTKNILRKCSDDELSIAW